MSRRFMAIASIVGLLTSFTTNMAVAGSLVARGAVAGGITLTNPWSRATPPGISIGAAYITIRAGTGQGDNLTGVSSTGAEHVEVHSHAAQGRGSGMQMVREIDLPPGKIMTFKPGGYHLMLIGLHKPLKAGGVLSLTLQFAVAGSIRMDVPILPAWSLGPTAR